MFGAEPKEAWTPRGIAIFEIYRHAASASDQGRGRRRDSCGR